MASLTREANKLKRQAATEAATTAAAHNKPKDDDRTLLQFHRDYKAGIM